MPGINACQACAEIDVHGNGRHLRRQRDWGRDPHGCNCFQLYMRRDRVRSMVRVGWAAAGFDAPLATVDVPVTDARLRDKRKGRHSPRAPSSPPHPSRDGDFLTEPLPVANST